MKLRLLLPSLVLAGLSLHAQNSNTIRVFLKDKGSSKTLLAHPEKVLSPDALKRRALQDIPLQLSDLPIAPEYREEIKGIGGQIKAHSKWLNYLLVEHDQPDVLLSLPFVDHIEFPQAHHSALAGLSGDTFSYALGQGQIAMLSGDSLHRSGYTGRGITIAVIDAGFYRTNTLNAFDSLRNSGRLLGTYNFINGDTNVYTGNGLHGTEVLSTMAAMDTLLMVGTAPHANYWLLSSENIHHERPIEMDHWVMAAEFADSVGAHVINSSLSYKTFDNPSHNYTYSQMDGNTTVITKAADIAASKGILVVIAAGNSGDGPLPHIGAPADADSVLTVGAVTWESDYALFSSRGPSADGRVKPDVMAQGSPTIVLQENSLANVEFGTSYAAPLIAGLAACLIEANPARHSEEIANFIRQSAHLYSSPNDSMGYGIPNFGIALSLSEPKFIAQEIDFNIYPNPSKDHIIIQSNASEPWESKLIIYDMRGKIIQTQDLASENAMRVKFNLDPGLYIFKLVGDLAGSYRVLVD